VAWVIAVILLVAVIVVAAILGRQISILRDQLKASQDAEAAAIAASRAAAAAEPAPQVEAQPAEAMAAETPPTEAEPAAPAMADEPPVAESHAEAQAPAELVTPAEPVTPAPAPDDGRLPSLWALTLLEQQRQWRLTVSATPAGVAAPDNLAAALDIEVERIREEVGTPGTLRAELSPTSTADDALIFHATRQLLALLVPHTQAFDLVLSRDGDHGVVELTCSGWEGPDDVAEGVGRLLEAVAPAGGDLELDMLPDERLQATLRLPLH
jgi:hypothetical protein